MLNRLWNYVCRTPSQLARVMALPGKYRSSLRVLVLLATPYSVWLRASALRSLLGVACRANRICSG